MKRPSEPARIAFVILSTILFIPILQIFRISAIPWEFAYLVIGRIFGPILGLVLSILIPIAILLIPAIILINFTNSANIEKSKDLWILVKKKRTIIRVVLGLGLAFLVILSFSTVFMLQIHQTGTKIDLFVAANANQDLEHYVSNVSSFLNHNVQNAYNRPEVLFRIDNEIVPTLLDPYTMKTFGVTRADLTIYQGWGTCGQAAILIEELLTDAGYETRDARFMNLDHQWAEVNHDGKWLIVDPWYIGSLVNIQNLKNLKPEFQQASGVEVQYVNGTTVDASHEHGY